MTFRARLTVTTAAAVALATVLASVTVFFASRAAMRAEIDRTLNRRKTMVTFDGGGFTKGFAVGPDIIGEVPVAVTIGGEPGVYVQFVDENHRIIRAPDQTGAAIPPDRVDDEVAAGVRASTLRDRRVGGSHLRVLTVRGPKPGTLFQMARPLDEVDGTLRRLAWILVLLCAGGVGFAAATGFVATRAAAAPVRHLTDTAEHVARTGDLTRRIESAGHDEVGRLAASFNAMLDALERSVGAQRRLVSDASHELRTPLTSVRTNIEVLARSEAMDPADRERLIADVTGQLEELSSLVNDLVEVARAPAGPAAVEDVALDALAEQTASAMRRRFPDATVRVYAEPCVVRGVASRIERALTAVVDNAIKWSPPSDPVEVEVARGSITVRDRGPGFEADDLPRVFDGFFRSDAARSTPGSGLGLAIAREVAAEHGGSVRAANRPGGGAEVALTFPTVS